MYDKGRGNQRSTTYVQLGEQTSSITPTETPQGLSSSTEMSPEHDAWGNLQKPTRIICPGNRVSGGRGRGRVLEAVVAEFRAESEAQRVLYAQSQCWRAREMRVCRD